MTFWELLPPLTAASVIGQSAIFLCYVVEISKLCSDPRSARVRGGCHTCQPLCPLQINSYGAVDHPFVMLYKSLHHGVTQGLLEFKVDVIPVSHSALVSLSLIWLVGVFSVTFSTCKQLYIKVEEG